MREFSYECIKLICLHQVCMLPSIFKYSMIAFFSPWYGSCAGKKCAYSLLSYNYTKLRKIMSCTDERVISSYPLPVTCIQFTTKAGIDALKPAIEVALKKKYDIQSFASIQIYYANFQQRVLAITLQASYNLHWFNEDIQTHY